MKSNNNDCVSIAKSIGIMLMVLGHTRFSEKGIDFIYLFHMPLFFFLSGLCFKNKYLNDFILFTKRKFIGIYLPFLKWTFFFILVHNLFFKLNFINDKYERF